MSTFVKLFVIKNNVIGNCKVDNKHIAMVAISLTTQTLDHFIRVRKRPVLGGRGRELGSRGGRENGSLLLVDGGGRRGLLVGE